LRGVVTAEAEVELMFSLTGRGEVLVLKNGFTGTICRNGMVESDRGKAAYTGPEFVDKVDRISNLAIIVDGASKELFAAGQRVRLYGDSTQ
jgi:hypothetical protein